MGEIPHADLRRICHKLPSDGVNRPGIQDTARVVVLGSQIRLGRRSSEIRRFGSELRNRKRRISILHPTAQPTGPPAIRNGRRRGRPGQLFSNATSHLHDALKNRRNVAIGDHPELQGSLQVVRVVNIHPAARGGSSPKRCQTHSSQGDILYYG